jgi:hypothetical protein
MNEFDMKKTVLKMPFELYGKVAQISTRRKIERLPNATQNKLLIELLEIGLKYLNATPTELN